MEKWIAAVTQHLKELKNGDQITSQSSSENSDFIIPDSPIQHPGKKCSFHKLVKTKNVVKDVKNKCLRCVPSTEDASTSEFDGGKGAFKPSTPRNRSILRKRRINGREIKPINALESCLTAQLFKEHLEMEDYMFSSFGSPSMQTVRPFFVTDSSKVISRASDDVLVVQNGNVYFKENDVFGVPPLPNREEKLSNSITTSTSTGKHFSLLSGSSHATLLICLGMTLGIISSFMSNKKEIEKLNRLLKQTENLVQDIHEDLEMKDALIVQELTVEGPVGSNVSFEDGSLCSISQHDLEESTSNDNREFDDYKAKHDSFSKIEAELAAELEMLELNMSSSSLKRRFSDQVVLEADNNHSADYVVSPRELSLRLHEVLESKLEERIRELEAEIEKKQTQNKKSFQSWKYYVDEQVVLKLSNEALDAYNEAYDQFLKVSDSEDQVTYSGQTSCHSGNGKDFEDDEMLIKHIVEKARKGSPAVLNAQRVFFSE